MSPKQGGRLRALFDPRTVAVVGASTNPGKIGGLPIALMREFGFRGEIYPVNPNAAEVQGLASFASIAQIGRPLDCAIIATPTRYVLENLQACADCGTKAAIVFSSGFAETGEDGRDLQRQMADLAARSGMRILGPNCTGVVNVGNGVASTFLTQPRSRLGTNGRIAVASQSGAVGAVITRTLADLGVSIATVVSTGNEADIEIAECIEHFVEDPGIGVVALYLEGARNGPRLISALRAARAARKPVIVLKVGDSATGAAAASSHTASIAGSSTVYDSVFKQAGAFRVRSIEELADVAAAASLGRFPARGRLGILTASGGLGILMADEAERCGLSVPQLPDPDRSGEGASVANPLDVTGQVANEPALLDRGFAPFLRDDAVDALIVCAPISGNDDPSPRLDIVEKRLSEPGAPLTVLNTMLTVAERGRVQEKGALVFPDAVRAVRAVGALSWLGRKFDEPAARVVDDSPDLAIDIAAAPHELEAMRLLGERGVPLPRSRLACKAAEALEAAGEIGFPVVLKLASRDIQHKSEIGGVRLGLETAAEVEAAFGSLLEAAAKRAPAARIDGVIVAAMERGEAEVIVGTNCDPVFGPVVMCGLGGIFVEALKDVAIRVAPVDIETATEMIEELRGSAVLKGARGRAPADVAAFADIIVKVSRIASASRRKLRSIEINPLILKRAGEGAVAADALIIPAGEAK